MGGDLTEEVNCTRGGELNGKTDTVHVLTQVLICCLFSSRGFKMSRIDTEIQIKIWF